jgi:3-phenylpropionate/cinnamic acid dioxygenase small subunit
MADRLAAEAVVTAYATALDARDWTGFTALFDETVEIDYRSLGTSYGAFPASEWADRCRVLEGFDATHHKVTNFRVTVSGEGANVLSYVDAAHFLSAGGQTYEAYVLGLYEHRLVRRGEGWRISGCRLTVSGYPGGRERFEAAFAAARAAYAARSALR